MDQTLSEIVAERIQIKDTLESQVETVLTYTSVDDVTEQMILRDEYKADNARVMNKIKDKIAELEKAQRKLRECNTDIGVQIKKIEQYKFGLLYSRKHHNAN